MKTQIPICRAKKTNSDEYVEFISHYEVNNVFYAILKIVETNKDGWLGTVHLPLTQKIDPSTLEVSFDGEKFYLIETVRFLIKLAENTPSSELHKLLEAKGLGTQQ